MESGIAGSSASRTRGRKGWAAALLSLLLPGLGQMYNGQLGKALGFYLATSMASFLLLFAVWWQALRLERSRKQGKSPSRPGDG